MKQRLERWFIQAEKFFEGFRADHDPWPGSVRADLMVSFPQLAIQLLMGWVVLGLLWTFGGFILELSALVSWSSLLVLVVMRAGIKHFSAKTRERWISFGAAMLWGCGGLLPMAGLAQPHPTWSLVLAALLLLNLGIAQGMMFRYNRSAVLGGPPTRGPCRKKD